MTNLFPPRPSSFWDEHLELSVDAQHQALPAPRVLRYILHLMGACLNSRGFLQGQKVRLFKNFLMNHVQFPTATL